ncbi:MAG: hypothetical protein H7A51_00360 [Akkermansiaceae bacterium]|nr:hypothetical protein [Akkermansiaceae bacterium]
MKFQCPHCEQSISAESELAGLAAECPTCGQGFIVPDSDEGSTEQPDTHSSATKSPVRRPIKVVAAAFSLLVIGSVALAFLWLPDQESPVSTDNGGATSDSESVDGASTPIPNQSSAPDANTPAPEHPSPPAVAVDEQEPERELGLEEVRKRIGTATDFNIVHKFDPEQFPGLSRLGEVYEIRIPDPNGLYPPSSAILLTRETSFKSVGRASLWLLHRETIEVKMKSGFSEEFVVLEEAPSYWVKEFYRIVEEQSDQKKTEGRKMALKYAAEALPPNLELPKIHLSKNLRRRNFSTLMEVAKHEELIAMAKNEEWLPLLERLSKYSKFTSERDVDSAIRNLTRREWEITVNLRSTSSKTESSFSEGAQPRVRMGIIILPPDSSKIFSVTDKGIEKVANIPNLREELYNNSGSIKLKFDGSSVYLFELAGQDGYRHRMFQERYKYIGDRIEEANSKLSRGEITKEKLTEIADQIEQEMRGNFAESLLNDF